MTRKILCVFGTRPEAIKMAPVVGALLRRSDAVETCVCVTAQHRQMLDQILQLFDIRPQRDLNIMRDDQSLTEVTASALTGLESVLADERPDWVLVQGDTTTAMVAGLAAFYHRVQVGHVEAGLRTRNKFHPFPEEMNRKIIDTLSDLHFAPTKTARQNLLSEGFDDRSIVVTGNTIVDAVRWVAAKPFEGATLNDGVAEVLRSDLRTILVTTHRRESFGRPIENVCRALREIAQKFPDVRIVYPVHLNPNVHQPVHRWLGGISNITLLPPLDYLPWVHLMKHSYLVVTDSGGIQEEAPGLGKPVLVLREVTERPEAVQAGIAKLVGTDVDVIVAETRRLLEDRLEYERMARAVNPYGDGHAAERIVDALLERWTRCP